MERVEILHQLVKWQEKDKKNRAILIIASERKEAEGHTECSQGLSGASNNIILMLKNALKNDKMLANFLKVAIEELTIESMFEKFKGVDNKKTEGK